MVDVVAVKRTIAASPQQIFDLLADPAMHPVLDGSGSVRDTVPGNPVRLSLGAEFGMRMRIGAKYRITNSVLEYDEPRQIAWRHFNGHVWRYRLVGNDDGSTTVTEEWDPRPAHRPWILGLLGFPGRNRRGMTATLQRLADRFDRFDG